MLMRHTKLIIFGKKNHQLRFASHSEMVADLHTIGPRCGIIRIVRSKILRDDASQDGFVRKIVAPESQCVVTTIRGPFERGVDQAIRRLAHYIIELAARLCCPNQRTY